MKRSIFDIQAEFCRAMGNATRLQILHILRERPMTVSEIMEMLELNQSMVSRQLSVLRSVGVVTGERDGNGVRYHLTDETIGEVCDLVRKVLIDQVHKNSNDLSGL
ncbi:MAG: metalloregulator ArsR/SmtB family transcription factor [Anaerolineales bacterium]